MPGGDLFKLSTLMEYLVESWHALARISVLRCLCICGDALQVGLLESGGKLWYSYTEPTVLGDDSKPCISARAKLDNSSFDSKHATRNDI